jgi:hypothetical protein
MGKPVLDLFDAPMILWEYRWRLQQIARLPPDERRQIMQLVDAFIERGQLKRRSSSQATSG